MPDNDPISFAQLNTLQGINITRTIQDQLDSKDTDALSENKILVGSAAGLSEAVDLSGGGTIVSTGVMTLGGKKGYTTTATAAGSTTLTAASTVLQYFTGATTQTVVLPVVSTLALGWQFTIVNLSSGAVTINSSGGNAVATVSANTSVTVTCILVTGTSAASWSILTGQTTAALTASRALASGSAGQLVAATTTATELGYVNGVTSAIQTQIDSKLTSPTWTTFTPTVTLVGGAGNTVPVYTTNTGRFSQIGKTAVVDVYLTGDGGAEGAGSGVLNIALPAAAGASTPAGKFPVGYGLNNALESILYGVVGPAATTVSLSYFNAIGTTTDYIGDSQNNATRTIRLHFSYEVA